ncbi:MAG: trypsin-like peptidase domain-containing protein, partial [Planctomycetota bacterium]|nr:trypsin-like peptidase domain-containing protein [Planctomycetota bacterium]
IRVLTNRHVAEGSSPGSTPKLTIRTILGDEIDATIIWAAEHSDVALLTGTLTNAQDKVSVAYTESADKNPSIGSKVFAIGNPHALGWSFTDGVVSRLPRHTQPDRTVTFIQTTTPINPGNSGGALYNERGYLVGMNTWKISQTIGEGLGFAISASSLLAERSDLLQVKKYTDNEPEKSSDKKDKKAE